MLGALASILLASVPANAADAVPKTFDVREASIVFVDETHPKAPQSAEEAEGGADHDLYVMNAKDFATRNGLKVFQTNATTVVFHQKSGKTLKVKNRQTAGGDAYFFDPLKAPKMIEVLPMVTDGKDFEAYFGRKAAPAHKAAK